MDSEFAFDRKSNFKLQIPNSRPRNDILLNCPDIYMNVDKTEMKLIFRSEAHNITVH